MQSCDGVKEDEVWMKDAAINRKAWVRGEGVQDSRDIPKEV